MPDARAKGRRTPGLYGKNRAKLQGLCRLSPGGYALQSKHNLILSGASPILQADGG
jgi:hypothetical protein